jgi:hypothetical protein
MTTYRDVPAGDVPAGLQWNVPRFHQGQIVEVAYAHAYPGRRDEADEGARWRRVIDRSDNSIWYGCAVADGQPH